jgi:hypothetical protein
VSALGPKSGPIITFYLPDPANPGGQVERAWMGEMTEAALGPDKGQTLITSACEGDDAEPWYLKGTAAQSAEAVSLWRFTWEHSGEVVGYSFAPMGNGTATANAPILSGLLTVGPKPPLGGSASDAAFSFGFEWRCTGEPILDAGEGGGE